MAKSATVEKTAAAKALEANENPSVRLWRAVLDQNGQPKEFMPSRGWGYVTEENLGSRSEDRALAMIREKQAAYAHSGYDALRGVFWAHNGAPNRRVERTEIWWLVSD